MAGAHFGNLSLMLGGKPTNLDEVDETSGKGWKPDLKLVKAVIVFAMATGRLAVEKMMTGST